MIPADVSADLRVTFAGTVTGSRYLAVAAVALVCLVGAETAMAEATPPLHIPLDSILDWMSHVLVGALAAIGGVLAHRAWSRRRWHSAPVATVIEAVLAVDLVNSTWLATHHGEELAMRARNLLERRALAAAEPRGVTFMETTGDGCMMTFPSADAAAQAATKLLRGLRERPPDMTPGPVLEVRAAVAYGEILLDARGTRHGATINRAFRLMSVPNDAFVAVEGEERLPEIPDRNRIFVDEDAANELGSANVAIRQVGVCRLKGFSGFHRVFELQWVKT